MNNTIILTLIHPLLGKIKPYQNLSLIISGITLLTAFILFSFNNQSVSNINGYIILSSGVFIILFIILSMPSYFFKSIKLAIISNGVMSIEINHKPTEYDIQKLRFLLNIDNKLLESKETLTPETTKDLSAWGNYIIIPSENTSKDIYVPFMLDVDLLKTLPQLKIETYKSRPILMNDTIDLLKDFMGMLWGAS